MSDRTSIIVSASDREDTDIEEKPLKATLRNSAKHFFTRINKFINLKEIKY